MNTSAARFLFLCLLLVTGHARAAELPTLDAIKAALPARHPRLYFTPSSLAELRDSLSPDKTAYLERLKSNSPVPVVGAANDALTALFDGHTPTTARTFLLNNNPPNDYYYFTLRHYVQAFDWVYEGLSSADRTAIINKLVTLGTSLAQNSSDAKGDFYRPKLALFYIGLVLHGTSAPATTVDDFLRVGYDDHLAAFAFREQNGADDGGVGDHTFAYVVARGDTIQSTVDFLWTLRALGLDATDALPSVGLYGHWLLRASIPAAPGELSGRDGRHHGFGWEWHGIDQNSVVVANEFSMPIGLLANLGNLYASDDNVKVSRHLMSWTSRKWVDEVLQGDRYCRAAPLLFGSWPTSEASGGFLAELPRARLFSQGQIFASSGFGPDDTYLGFIGGTAMGVNHKNWDEGHFVLYKRGFLALDSGTREMNGHIQNYYERTIAHNGLTVRMPNESFPNGLAGQVVAVNDGGQNKRFGSVVTAFETNDIYSYWAVDLLPTYSSSKVSEVTRQFVFLPPDYVVVFDRVVSTNASYPKKFIYHAVGDFSLSGNTFSASHQEGRVFVRTLFPEGATLTKIGGPGMEFSVDGVNYPISRPHELLGSYRMEVSPPSASTSDQFLHVIQVGLASSLSAMLATTPLSEAGRSGVAFATLEGQSVRVLFNKSGVVGGEIEVAGSRRSLNTSVTPQSGLARTAADGPGSGGTAGTNHGGGGDAGTPGSGGNVAAGGTGNVGTGGSGWSASGSGGEAADDDADAETSSSGCGCRVARSAPASSALTGALFALLTLGGYRGARRRSRSAS
jgi:heparin/heparan-sulfate lyase